MVLLEHRNERRALGAAGGGVVIPKTSRSQPFLSGRRRVFLGSRCACESSLFDGLIRSVKIASECTDSLVSNPRIVVVWQVFEQRYIAEVATAHLSSFLFASFSCACCTIMSLHFSHMHIFTYVDIGAQFFFFAHRSDGF